MADEEITHHDENTIRKVYEALLEVGIFGQQAVDAVSSIQNKGIFFRERKPKRRGRPAGSKNKEKNLEERVLQSTYGEDARTNELEADLTSSENPIKDHLEKDSWTPLDGATGA